MTDDIRIKLTVGGVTQDEINKLIKEIQNDTRNKVIGECIRKVINIPYFPDNLRLRVKEELETLLT